MSSTCVVRRAAFDICHFPKLLNCVSTLTVMVWRQKWLWFWSQRRWILRWQCWMLQWCWQWLWLPCHRGVLWWCDDEDDDEDYRGVEYFRTSPIPKGTICWSQLWRGVLCPAEHRCSTLKQRTHTQTHIHTPTNITNLIVCAIIEVKISRPSVLKALELCT